MVRSMMSQADLPKSFWGFTLEIAAFTLNRVPSKSVDKTPYETWFGRKPSMSFLKIWGCEAYVKRLMSDKLGPKSDKCYFVGYSIETKGYYFCNRSENKIIVARYGVFLEKEFLSRRSSESDGVIEEIHARPGRASIVRTSKAISMLFATGGSATSRGRRLGWSTGSAATRIRR